MDKAQARVQGPVLVLEVEGAGTDLVEVPAAPVADQEEEVQVVVVVVVVLAAEGEGEGVISLP
ncbi:hypothetical protein NY78_2948 [Desulfovibrio sp. TomC]|nr:hypothetical protein NY78_2948 [Desulfovibrio sp. TomC]